MRELSLIMMHVNSRGSLESLVRQRLSRFDVRRLKEAIAAFRSADDSSTGMAPASAPASASASSASASSASAYWASASAPASTERALPITGQRTQKSPPRRGKTSRTKPPGSILYPKDASPPSPLKHEDCLTVSGRALMGDTPPSLDAENVHGAGASSVLAAGSRKRRRRLIRPKHTPTEVARPSRPSNTEDLWAPTAQSRELFPVASERTGRRQGAPREQPRESRKRVRSLGLLGRWPSKRMTFPNSARTPK